jgi:heme/copper-type cytochrome/quinol oxidase subunit 2
MGLFGQLIPLSILLIYGVILFIIMIYSSIASVKASEGDNSAAYKTSRHAAIIAGVTELFTIIVVITYLYYKFSPTGKVTSFMF